MEYGYLHHGPFQKQVRVKMEPPFNWFARFEGRWRKVRVQVGRTYIVYRGERITIQIDGV